MTKYPEHVSTSQPRSVSSNVCFLVDLDKLNDPRDVMCGDLGAWDQSRTSKKWYSVNRDSSGNAVSLSFAREKEGSYEVVRRPFVNLSDNALKKTMVSLTDPKGQNFNIVAIIYQFTGEEHVVTVKPHGNSKCNISFLRTYQSTKMKIAKESGKSVPSRAFHNVSRDVGGLGGAEAAGQLPRNCRQVSYYASKIASKVEDPIYSITAQMRAYCDNDEERYVRAYSLDDSSAKVVLFTDTQVDDIINFCCNDSDGYKSLLYADITFELGPFFLLTTSYKNTALIDRKSGSSPTMIGPMMLCLLKDKETYLTLFQKLNSKAPGLQLYLHGYSTDSEKALRQALAHEFPRSLQFLCYIHAKRNISDKCRSKFNLSQQLTSEILADIFSQSGLVYCQSTTEFREMVKRLKMKWDCLEERERRCEPKFSEYFEKYKETDILNHMLVKTATDAGFGTNLQSNNIPESLNAKIKRWQNFKAADMAQFVEDMKSLVDKQTDDTNRAYLGLSSPYTVREEFQTTSQNHPLNVPKGRERDQLIKAKRVIIDQNLFKTVKGYVPHAHVPQILQEANNEYSEEKLDDLNKQIPEVLLSTNGSLPADDNDDYQELRKVFSAVEVRTLTEKAASLVHDCIMKGFSDDSYFVKSISSSSPHTVRLLKNGGIVCDVSCLGFGTRKICSHTLAVAIHTGSSKNFIRWYVTEKHDANLTRLTTFQVNKNAGRKAPPRRQSRKRSPDASSGQSLGDFIRNPLHTPSYAVASSPGNLKVVIKRKMPQKPIITPTAHTQFELIDITGCIRKCAGCYGELKKGPNDCPKTRYDEMICVRHKERDYAPIHPKGGEPSWKEVFENRHYHISFDCISRRNPKFDANDVKVKIKSQLTADLLALLTSRLQSE